MGNLSVLLTGVVLYMLGMIAIGWYSKKITSSAVEDYYLANRGLSGFVLFCTILGTNMSAFVMLGMAGAAYRAGIGMYGLIMGAGIVGISLFPWIWGTRAWALGKKFKYLTPTDFIENRFQSPLLSILVFLIFVMYTLPYITTGQIGAGAAFAKFTNGVIPFWLGSLIVTAIVGYYVWSGGMRGTSFTNVVQVVIFLTFLITTLFWIGIQAGGASAILEKVKAINPELLHRGNEKVYSWQSMFSQFLLMSISIFSFPHIYVRFLSARSSAQLRKTATVYPLGIMLTWVPACIIGFWGVALAPGLKGTASDNVLFILTGQFLPVWMFAFAVIALLAIVMSTMDAQTLTISSLFSNDILKTRLKKSDSESVKWGKLFVVIVLGFSYLLSLLQPATVFQLAIASFTGAASIVPVLLGGMYWKRLNKQGAIASVLTGFVLVPLYFAGTFLPNSPTAKAIAQAMPRFNFDPIVPVIAASSLVMVVVTLLTAKQVNKVADEQFAFLDQLYKKGNQSVSDPIPPEPSSNVPTGI